VDAVVVSHVHFDHLDLASLELLDPDVRVVVPRGAGSLLTGRGLVDVVEVDEGDEIAVRDVRVRATHADHDATRGPLGVRAASLGYVLEGTGSVYFAGDTGPFDGMASLAPALDVAL